MATPKDSTKEERITAASYVLGFYKEVSDLTHNYAAYVNLLLYIQNAGAEDQQKVQLTSILESVRFFVNKTYIFSKTIAGSVNLKLDPEIEKLYKKMTSEYVIKKDDLESYVLAMNKFLIEDLIKDLLKTSNDLVSSIYNG